MRNVLSFLGTVILLLATEMLTALYQPALAETILVSEDFASDPLIDAIEAAAPGDTIRVAAGEYTAGISIEKPLTLIGAGADRTRVYDLFGAPSGEVFGIEVEEVTIEGFHLSGCNTKRIGCSAVACLDCSATLRHNIISGGQSAVWILGDSRLTINYNEFRFGYGIGDGYGIESYDNPNTVDARFNWWGTTDGDEIKERIASNMREVEYRPWLQDPGDIFNELPTLISTVSWGRLKRKGH